MKWTSSNVAATSVIGALLVNQKLNTRSSIQPQNEINSEVAYLTANDGQEIFTLPQLGTAVATDLYGYGTNFKIELQVHDTAPGGLPGGIPGGILYPLTTDLSDNLFTIQAPTTINTPIGCTSNTDFVVSLDSNTPPAQNVLSGTKGVKFAEYNITSCKDGLQLEGIQSDLMPVTQISAVQNLHIVGTSNIVSDVISNPSSHLYFYFPTHLIFSANETKKLEVIGDIKDDAVVGSQIYFRLKAFGWAPNGGIVDYGNGIVVSNIFTVYAPTTTSLDPTPRIAYWYGKVNQHVDAQGNWMTDPDGRSGATIDKLTYCKKWYPNTTSVIPYISEKITWYSAGNVNPFEYPQISDKCVQGIIPPIQTGTEKILFMGGKINDKYKFYNDIYSSSNMYKWDLVSQNNDTVIDNKWSGRSNALSVYFKNQYWLIGGRIPFSTNQTDSNEVWSSVDGITWTKKSSIQNLDEVTARVTVFNGKMYILNAGSSIGSSDKMLSSSDGVNWTSVSVPDLGLRVYPSFFTFGNKMYVLGGSKLDHTNFTDIWSSYDGSIWTQVTNQAPWGGNLVGAIPIVYNNTVYLIGGQTSLNASVNTLTWHSTDGVNWSSVVNNKNMLIGDDIIVANNRIWYTGNDDPYLWNSIDGSNWVKSCINVPWPPRYWHSMISNGGTPSNEPQSTCGQQSIKDLLNTDTNNNLTKSDQSIASNESISNNVFGFTRGLKLGLRGEDVKALQRLLHIKVDGIYGNRMLAKVKEWQISNGLKADGIFGPASRQKISSN